MDHPRGLASPSNSRQASPRANPTDEIEEKLTPENHALCVELAAVPLAIKGYGHVKLANAEKAKAREKELLRKPRAAKQAKGRKEAA